MEDQEQIQRECLHAVHSYLDTHSLRSYHPILMELQLDQEEQASYTHKFFVMVQDRGAIVYRIGAGRYAVSENIIPDDPAREKELQRPFDLIIQGIPDDLPETVAALCRSRLHHAVTELLSKTRLKAVKIMIETTSSRLDMLAGSPLETEHAGQTRPSDDPPIEVRALQYKAQQPLFTF